MRPFRIVFLSCATLSAAVVACGAPPDPSPGADLASLDHDLTVGSSGGQVEAVYQYLRTFGYFPNDDLQRSFPAWRPLVATPPERTDVFDAQMEAATRALQHNAALPETGVVDQATRAVLAQPRCGVPDGIQAMDESDKFALLNNGLKPSSMTWNLLNNSTALPIFTVRQDISLMLGEWALTSGYSFTQTTSSTADILLQFGALPAGVNAATTPRSGGDSTVTFSVARTWSNSAAPPAGTMDLQSIAVHELGHAIGLNHSSFASPVMNPIFNVGQTPKRALTVDDSVGALAMNTRWTQFDSNSDREVVFNGHHNGDSIWVLRGTVAGGHEIWELINRSIWVRHPGGAVHISVNPFSDGNTPWVVNDQGNIFRFNSGTGNWDSVPGCGRDVGVGEDDSVWVIGCDNLTGGHGLYKFTGTFPCSSNCFTKSVDGAGVRIAVGPRTPGGPNVPWVVDQQHLIWRRTSPLPSAGNMEMLPGRATDIAAASGYAWSIAVQTGSRGQLVQVWDEQPAGAAGGPPPPAERTWITAGGAAFGGANIAMTTTGQPLVVTSGQSAFWSF
jgi:hypothetical protein